MPIKNKSTPMAIETTSAFCLKMLGTAANTIPQNRNPPPIRRENMLIGLWGLCCFILAPPSYILPLLKEKSTESMESLGADSLLF